LCREAVQEKKGGFRRHEGKKGTGYPRWIKNCREILKHGWKAGGIEKEGKGSERTALKPSLGATKGEKKKPVRHFVGGCYPSAERKKDREKIGLGTRKETP